MPSFNYTIDTRELASSLDAVSAHVAAATAAVTGTQAAVIAAEKDAADKICQHVDRGFFALIRSQITQKMARLKAEADTRFLEMRQQSRALLEIRSRMERDYKIIAVRNNRLFQSIDRALRARIFELERPVSAVVRPEAERLYSRLLSGQAQTTTHQSESVSAGQLVAAASRKRNALQAISAIGAFLAGSVRATSLLNSAVFEGPVPTSSGLQSIPVLLAESESPLGGFTWDFYSPNGLAKPVQERIDDAVNAAALGNPSSISWSDTNTIRKAVDAEFRRLVAKAGLDHRVQALMTRMFETSACQQMPHERRE